MDDLRTTTCRIGAVMALACAGVLGGNADANATAFTSSAAFNAATAGDSFTVEQYASGTNGQTIANPGSFDGLSYSFTSGGAVPGNTLTGGIITNGFNSISGLSLGGNQSDGPQYFFGGDEVTVTFSTPITAVGVFFNVNPDSGNFHLDTPGGDAITGSASYDTSTFVFDGITSSTAFSSITFFSDNLPLGSYNIPEIEYAATVPEPGTLALFGMALLGLCGLGLRRKTA